MQAFTVVEVVMSLLIVSLIMLGALRTAGSIGGEARVRRERVIAHQLASELLAEIAVLPYQDPDGSPVFGMESDEADAAGRTALDDIDDFVGWVEIPIQDRAGTAIPAFSQWRRSVQIERITTPSGAVAATETGLRAIVVSVVAPSGKTFTQRLLRSQAEYRDRTNDDQILRIGIGLKAGVDGSGVTESATAMVVLENAPLDN